MGNEGSVFECEMCEIDVKNTKKAKRKVNDCIFFGIMLSLNIELSLDFRVVGEMLGNLFGVGT